MTEQTGPIPGHPDYPWEPPLAGTELEHLVGMLDRLRWTFRWKASGLDAEGLDKRLAPSALTLGGLLQHLAAGEALRFTWDLDHSDPGEPWRSADWADDPDWTFSTAADKTPEELYRLYDDSVRPVAAASAVTVRPPAGATIASTRAAADGSASTST